MKKHLDRSVSIVSSNMHELERYLIRCRRALGNKRLLPKSRIFYTRRQQLLETEIERRNTLAAR
jgi:hypothetical protein